MGFCHRCGELVHGANCLKCGGRSVMSVTSGLSSTGSRNDPWISAYQNILEGGINNKSSRRTSMPASSLLAKAQPHQHSLQHHPTSTPPPQPLVLQKQCHGCHKAINQAKVFVEAGKPTFLYCEKCYTEKFTKGLCPSCLKPVMSKTDPYITHAKRSWHSACFVCFKCRIDVSTVPMVDLKGRPSCEDCLMAQAGDAASPDQQRSTTTLLTPHNRSLAGSPELSPSSSIAVPRSIQVDDEEPAMEHQYLRPNPASLRLNLDTGIGHHSPAQQSPLSAQSSSSHSSFGASFRQSASSGYTSGTSSTYSSLGRKRSNSSAPNALAVTSAAPTNIRTEGGFLSGGSLLNQRPGSSLSIHSYTSSPSSPILPQQDNGADMDSQNHTICQGTALDHHRHHESQEESARNGILSSGSRPMADMNDLGHSPSSLNDLGHSPSSLNAASSVFDSSLYPSSHTSRSSITALEPRPPMVADTSTGATSTSPESESELVASTKKLTISTTSLNESARSTPSQNATSHPPRPTLQRVRSRSSVGPATAGMVRARTEAWMNNAQSSATSLQAKIQRPVPGNVFNTQYRSTTAETTKPTFTNSSHGTRNEPAVSAPLEPEPNRSQLHRHGRQRSNTVGEAVSFPAVKVDSLASPTSERASIPENHCHKCLERVTENGIRLQNGDRFHIGCFLCYGCHQIFTESEFHVVNGRPYHPGCVSLAPAVNITGIVTKCFHCHKIIGNKSIRLGVMNYHPECFTCTHCQKILHSTSRFFEVDGRVECEQCCEERDRDRLAPKIVPVARRKDNFAVPPPAVPVTVSNQGYGKVLEPSGPGMMASANGMVSPIPGQAKNIARSGSGYGSPNGYGHSNGSGQSSPQRSPASPGFAYSAQGGGGGENHSPKDLGLSADSPVIMMASPAAIRASPPVLTSLFSTRTRPLPKFGGVTICPRCQQAVGVMDQVPGPKNEKWHKKCLNCKGCKKVLDSSAMTRGEGEAYCRGCYNKTRARV